MTPYAFIAVGLKFVMKKLGMHWACRAWLNHLLSGLSQGHFSCNVFCGYLLEIILLICLSHPAISAEVRLSLMSVFFGALTTFVILLDGPLHDVREQYI